MCMVWYGMVWYHTILESDERIFEFLGHIFELLERIKLLERIDVNHSISQCKAG